MVSPMGKFFPKMVQMFTNKYVYFGSSKVNYTIILIILVLNDFCYLTIEYFIISTYIMT